MPRYAIGDVQGCYQPLRALLRRLKFSADRDRLYFVGDLVNRGPQSLQVLRFVRALDGNAETVLGNHDLHLLAHHFDPARPLHRGDTLQDVLAARDRETLIEWLLQRPLLLHDAAHADLIVHAGLVPQWTLRDAKDNAARTMRALRADPAGFLARMYGNRPDNWQRVRSAADRERFTINVLTRLRYCKADGTIDLKLKEAPEHTPAPWKPWFEQPHRRRSGLRVIFGHWSTLGLRQQPGILALDTGCVWGGTLTAADLDDPERPPVQRHCRACQQPGAGE